MHGISSPNSAVASGVGYAQHGDGPEHVLVMHDWNGDHTTYSPAIPYLDGETSTHVFVDLRGYGNSRDLPGDFTVQEISANYLALADRLGWRRCHPVGHSMTGMAAQRVAVEAGTRVKSAVAVRPMRRWRLLCLASQTRTPDHRELRTLPDAGMSAPLRHRRGTLSAQTRRSGGSHPPRRAPGRTSLLRVRRGDRSGVLPFEREGVGDHRDLRGEFERILRSAGVGHLHEICGPAVGRLFNAGHVGPVL